MAEVHGLVLAAGAGTRMGRPKALVRGPDGTPWLAHAVQALADGGCGAVSVVLGASAASAAPLVPSTAEVLLAEDWAEGMAASLRAGLQSLTGSAADAALVHLVDLPDVGADVVRRLLADTVTPAELRRAGYDGRPGHPVLLGRDHWQPIAGGLAGDHGARAYLVEHEAALVECGDLASGRDVDSW